MRTYHTAEGHRKDGEMPISTLKTERPFLATSNCISKFSCNCGAGYLGRTERRLETRVSEHIPKYVTKTSSSANKLPASSIGRHLVETGHRVDITTAFKVVLVDSSPRILRFAEALAIQRFHPILCKQRNLHVTLYLPWHRGPA